MLPICPCKDCNERHELCHAQCEKYAKWCKAKDEFNEIIREGMAKSRL